MYFATNYFKQESFKNLSINVKNITAMFKTFPDNDIRPAIACENLAQAITIIGDATGSSILVCDEYGKLLAYTGDAKHISSRDNLVSDKILSDTLVDYEYTELGLLSGVFKLPNYTAGAPLITAKEEMVGYVFASEDASSLSGFLYDMLSLFIVASATMLAVSSVLSIFMSERLTGPIRKISEAAQSFGNGNFTSRVEVVGNNEVSRLADTFNKMATNLEAIDTSRQSFMGDIAHEIRTPMTSVQGFVDGMLDGTIPPERRDYYLKIVSGEVGRLSRLTHSMLDVTKLETGEYVVAAQNYDVWETIINISLSREKEFAKKGVKLTGFDPQKLYVFADKDIVHQVFYNIMDNALKFTPENGIIDIITEQKQGFVTIGIMNIGDGIPADALPYIFDRFYKADKSRGLNTGGSGLGLHICKQLINRSGGKIWAESTPNEQTKFFFSLPSGKAPSPDRKQPERNRGSK